MDSGGAYAEQIDDGKQSDSQQKRQVEGEKGNISSRWNVQNDIYMGEDNGHADHNGSDQCDDSSSGVAEGITKGIEAKKGAGYKLQVKTDQAVQNCRYHRKYLLTYVKWYVYNVHIIIVHMSLRVNAPRRVCGLPLAPVKCISRKSVASLFLN